MRPSLKLHAQGVLMAEIVAVEEEGRGGGGRGGGDRW